MEYFGIFFLLVIFGALVINGWFLASRGEIEIQPDGTEKRDGALFRGWQIFWEQKREGKKMIQYKGKQLYDKKREIIQTAKNEGYTGAFLFFDEHILTTKEIEKYVNAIEYQIRNTSITITKTFQVSKSEEASVQMTVYKMEDIYLFPEWVRSMMASCITCHASVYGSVIFWTYILLFGKFTTTDVQFVATWIAYILSLAFVNTFFYKTLNKQ